MLARPIVFSPRRKAVFRASDLDTSYYVAVR